MDPHGHSDAHTPGPGLPSGHTDPHGHPYCHPHGRAGPDPYPLAHAIPVAFTRNDANALPYRFPHVCAIACADRPALRGYLGPLPAAGVHPGAFPHRDYPHFHPVTLASLTAAVFPCPPLRWGFAFAGKEAQAHKGPLPRFPTYRVDVGATGGGGSHWWLPGLLGSLLHPAAPEAGLRRWGVILALLVGVSSCVPAAPAPESTIWFLEVEREGGYWLGPNALSRMGLDPCAASPPAFSLSVDGREIPILPLEAPDGWGVFFFAPYRPTRYAVRTAIRLGKGLGGARMLCDETKNGGSFAPVNSGRFSLHLEENHRYLPQAETEIPWLWAPLYAPGVLTFTLHLTDAVPGPISLTLHLWSHTDFPPGPDHHLRLWWDGRPAGEWEWGGAGMRHLSAQWEEGSPSGEHQLVLEALLPPGIEASLVWVDSLDIAYRRAIRPVGEIWEAEGESLQVDGAGPATFVLDVTDPLYPRGLCPLSADGRAATVPGHRYWIGDPRKAPAPVALRPAHQVDGWIPDAEYLVIAPALFQRALSPLMEHRRAQGLRVAMVEPAAIYDTFGNGQPDPKAIRRFADRLPSLRYLLLVGDGTVRPASGPGLELAPPMTRTTVLGETPSDGLLGLGPTGQARLAVGRLPARSPWEVEMMVGKILRWETETAGPAALVVHDDEPEFQPLAEEIQDWYRSSGLPEEKTGNRAHALELLKDGRVWLNYIGHGSLTVLAKDGILKPDDGVWWRGSVLVVAWTCLAAHFAHPSQESLAEEWLRAPGGTVAFLGPVGETTVEEQHPFAIAFYRALGKRARLGDAWLDALQAEGSRDVALSYTLLGDPALFWRAALGEEK